MLVQGVAVPEATLHDVDVIFTWPHNLRKSSLLLKLIDQLWCFSSPLETKESSHKKLQHQKGNSDITGTGAGADTGAL